jgi:AcrR family transcriptional regulator
MVRLTHAERKERTRSGLVTAGLRVFLERGFHGASLDDIAEQAGYSKGAVYSNFAGKDELFLAVLDAQFEQRLRVLADVLLDQDSLEESYRAVARSMAAADEGEPRWTPLLLEFWAHASRRPSVRAAVSQRRERFFTVIAGMIDELGARHGVRFAIPSKEIARGSNALARGIALDRLLDPGVVSADLFEEMHTAYAMGMTRGSDGVRASSDGTRLIRKDGTAR